MQRFEPVNPKVSFPELEQRILEFWRDTDVFAHSIELRKDGPLWVFYEGPPTANGSPGIHHVEARVFKDVYPRFKTMTGHFVPRKGGWDCHGLPVELEVEKAIGTTGKRDIEAFGIERVQPAVSRIGGPLRRGVRTTDDPDRLLDRHVRCVLDHEHRVHRVRVVVAQTAPSARAARGIRQGHGVLPALRDRALGRRSGHGLSDGRGPQRLPAVPRPRGARPGARRRVVAGMDDDAVDASVQRGSRGRRRRVLRHGGARRRAARAR